MAETASELLVQAHTYLDSLDSAPSSPEEARERAAKIRELLSEMRRFNFHAPKFGIRDLFKYVALMEKEELIEAMPLLQDFLYSLNLRQWAYERAKVAYLANRLAYFLLKEEVMLDILPYLPYDGAYLSFAAVGGGPAYMAFRDIEKELKGERRLEFLFSGEVPLGVREKRKTGPVKHSTALLLAFFSVSKALDHMDDIVKEERGRVERYEEVLEYQRIVSRYDIQRLEENPELLWELLQELEERGFLEEDGSVRAYLVNGVRKMRFFRYNRLLSYARQALSFFLFRYYLFFQPWKGQHPLRGLPSDFSVLEPLLSDVEEGCRLGKADMVEYVGLARRASGLLPPKDVLDGILHLLCPSMGRPVPLIESLKGGRTSAFLEALESEEDKER